MHTQSEVRRKDREISDETFIKNFIRNSPFCTIAFNDENKYPIINNLMFVSNEENDTIYFHCSKHGQTARLLKTGSNVCVSISEMGKLYTAKRAMDFGVEYTSCIIKGTVEIIEEEKQVMRIFSLYFTKYFPDVEHGSYSDFTFEQASQTIVYKLAVKDCTAKQHLAPEHAGQTFEYKKI